MLRLTKLLVLVFYMITGNAFASTCPANNVISDPETFEWTFHPVSATNPTEYYSGTMQMGEATFTIGGETITTRAYGQLGKSLSIPGPTMIMQPGNKYVLRFENLLPFETPSTSHNVYKDPNISNLHTHGLHISGLTPGDDVTRSFEGGFGGDFVYDIPADHMGGTYWYHAHHHGSTFLQVSGGAFGMLLIDDSQDEIPVNVAAMAEKQLVIGFLDPSAAGTGGDTLIQGTLGSTWTVNGQVNSSTCMPANTWQHWRVLLADRDAKSKTVSIDPVAAGAQCEVGLMSRDGVWRTQVPKMLTTNSLELTGASRADLAVRCSGDAEINVNGNKVADVKVDGVGDQSANPFAADGASMWTSKRPAYLRDLRLEAVANQEVVKMGARTINGSKFDHHVPTFVLNTDGVEEWNIQGGAMHPFHLHIYHVQVIGDCGEFEDGEYYDVVSGNCKIRFDLNPNTSSVYQGRTILHCHILAHEDQGAMGWADVLGGQGAPTFPQDTTAGISFSEYTALGNNGTIPSAPSNLLANAVSSSQIDLSWNDNSNDEDSFTIQRSTDGSNFIAVSTPSANTTSHNDTNLQANTTYSYRVNAENIHGSSANSNTASAMTLDDAVSTTLVVDSITLSTVSVGRGQKQGLATLLIKDEHGNPISNAVVSGEFSGQFSEVVSASSASLSDGSIQINTTGQAKKITNLTFCVTQVVHPDLPELVASPGTLCNSL